MAIIRLAVQHDKTEKHILPMFSVFQNVNHGSQKEETMKLHFQIQLAALFTGLLLLYVSIYGMGFIYGCLAIARFFV